MVNSRDILGNNFFGDGVNTTLLPEQVQQTLEQIGSIGGGGGLSGGGGGNTTGLVGGNGFRDNLQLYVTSNEIGAEIYLNGVQTFQQTPAIVNIDSSTIFQNGTVEITVVKRGFITTERYTITLNNNPDYYGADYFGRINPVTGLPYDVIQNKAPFIFDVVKYNGQTIDFSFQYDYNLPQQNINFEFAKESIPIIPIDDISTINLNITQNDIETVRVFVKDNSLQTPSTKTIIAEPIMVLNEKAGSTIYISSNDLTKYRITKVEILSTTSIPQVIEAIDATESLSFDYVIGGDSYTINVTTEAAFIARELPEISLTSNDPYIYNLNSQVDIPVALVINEFTERIRMYVKDKEVVFNVPKVDPLARISNPIVIPHTFFDIIGAYKVTLVPSNANGDGNPISFTISVKNEVYVGVPDVRELIYPSELIGPDYSGTNVDFNIQYDTVNTDFVRLYVNDTTYIQNSAKGILKLNFKNLIEQNSNSIAENDNQISLSLRLVPFNTSGIQELKGSEKPFTIKFVKSKFSIPRSVAINRISDAFISQFDTAIFDSSTSKFLNYYFHLGNADNKVITTWTGSRDSLILKLYEPIPTAVQPNQQVWISKIISNPIIETINLVGEAIQVCNPIKGPNFSVEPDNGIGFQIYDELVASGSITSNDLINKYTKKVGIDTEKLNIQYISGSDYAWKNFINFGSAKERTDNFLYKIEQLEFYKTKYEQSIASGSLVSAAWSGSLYVSEIAKTNLSKINEIVRSFDGFEKFLYTSTDSLAYPKYVRYNSLTGVTGSILKPSDDASVTSWYNGIAASSEYYDKYNLNSLVNNLPEAIKEDYNNGDFFVFLNMIGQHFDIIWSYINALSNQKNLEHKQQYGIANEMISNMLESFGWQPKRAFNSQYLWEYVFGTDKDGNQKYSMPLKDANEEVWRRILNNLPYLLKHKGTSRALKAAMSCYGVPQSMLTIMEFGGPQNPSGDGVTQFTFDDRTAAIFLSSSYVGSETSNIKIPWKVIPNETSHPTTIEFRIKPSKLPNNSYTLLQASGSNWKIDLVKTTGSFGRLELNFGGDQAISPYFSPTGPNTPYINSSIIYAYGPDYKTGSLDFPISTEYYSNVLINRHDTAGTGSWYEVWYATTDGQKIITSVSMSISSVDVEWETGDYVQIGGNGFEGEVDEVRLWKTPLQRSKFNNHTLFPDAINGNSYTSSTTDLLFRLDFEYPINVATGTSTVSPYSIKNVAISEQYAESFATASSFYSASAYPYQYSPYDRTVTANVPSLGMTYGNKIRFENQYTLGGTSLFDDTTNQQTVGVDLSHRARVTQKAFDRAPIDSNRLGLFFSPIKELNMDILKAFGDFSIDDYIGDPADDYNDTYKSLDSLREYYFERLDRNINEYIQLVKYIDKSLFEVLEELSPARARISKGLLIEPHFLERSKVKWDRPTAESLAKDGTINATEHELLESENLAKDANLDASYVVEFTEEINNYDTLIDTVDAYELEGTNPSYESKIVYSTDDVLIFETPFYDVNIQAPTGSSLVGEADSFKYESIGTDPNSLSNAGFGLYGIRGTSIIKKRDMFGNTTTGRYNVYSVKESYTKKISTQIEGYPATPYGNVIYKDVSVTEYKYKVSKLDFPNTITTGGNVVEVNKLDNYFSTHYKFINGLGEGLQRSYWKGSVQTSASTPDGLSPVEFFTTNPNILRVAKTGRGSGEPILEVD